jgi:hypothetical protein
MTGYTAYLFEWDNMMRGASRWSLGWYGRNEAAIARVVVGRSCLAIDIDPC